LFRLTGHNGANEIWHTTSKPVDSSADLQPAYRKWWAEHKDTFDYEQAREKARVRAW